MAEFALGLTKTAVEGTLTLVKSAVEEEKKLREKVRNDLVFISGEFEMMQSFLRVANNRNRNDDQQLVRLTWVRQLRTLAFDVEDCVENVVHLDLDRSSRWAWLRRLWQTVNCRAPPLPLDEAVAEIKQLKARVEDVSQRNTRYNLILHGGGGGGGGGDDDNNVQQPVTVMPLSAEKPAYATSTTTYYPSPAAFHFLRDAWKATGKWSNSMCNLQRELSIASEGEDDHDLQVISIWGSLGTGGGGGGAGAGHRILTKAYYDPEVCENFRIRVWVKLVHPFNHDDFVKSLLAQFYASSSHQAKNAGADFCGWMKAEVIEADNLMKANNLMQQMSEQRYLVVVEDVLTMAEWDVVRMYLPDSKNGSRILLSTPQLGIALRLCTGEPPYQVSELPNFSGDDQLLCAFSKKEKVRYGFRSNIILL
jgi:hypothetical protein